MKSQQPVQFHKIPNSSKNIRLLHDQFNNHQQHIYGLVFNKIVKYQICREMRFQALLAFAKNVKLFNHLCHFIKSEQQVQFHKIQNCPKNN